MADHDWKTLLDDPEVEGIIERAYAIHGRRYYWRRADALLLDDLESWLWDTAVDLAVAWDASRFTEQEVTDAVGLFHSYLGTGLRNAIVGGYHRTEYAGTNGTERRRVNHLGHVSLDGLREERNDRFEAGIFASHTLRADDPLVIIIRREHLETVLRHARVAARQGPGYVCLTPSKYCVEPLCLKEAKSSGRCGAHYARWRQQWLTGACTVEGCTTGAQSKGLCGKHAAAAVRADPDRPRCASEGCEKASRTRGLCDACYSRHRKAGTLPAKEAPPASCAELGCEEPVKAKRLCQKHYGAARYQQRRAARG